MWEHVFKNLKKDLVNVCEEEYKSDPKDDSDDNYEHNAKKYCVLDASITLNKYPTKPS